MRLPRIAYMNLSVVTALSLMLGLGTFVLSTSVMAQTSNSLELRQSDSVEEYKRLTREIALSAQRQQELEAEIALMRDDSAGITAALIQAAKTERKLTEDIIGIGRRLEGLSDEETAVRLSLAKRRSVLAEVLAALQRMGLNPPPAILVRPEDALASVRSAILLGAVVPELRIETEKLIADLQDLSRVIGSIADEQSLLFEKGIKQAEEQSRLNLLLVEKNRLQSEVEATITNERLQAEQLALKARNIQDLIASLENEIASLQNDPGREKPGISGNRLPETIALSKRKGMLALPVAGSLAQRFGDDDGLGSTLKGDIVKTQSGAIVTAPAESTVVYAGPFRSYQQILILNPGDGYHIVLAGLDRLNVSLGQKVLTGEPVGVMGEARVASMSASSFGTATPELYVEFRQDGKPVDPKAWWARDIAGRTKNGS